MPKELSPQSMMPREEGNVKTFDEDADGLGMRAPIVERDGRIVLIDGEDEAGTKHQYVAQNGVYVYSDAEGTVKRGEYTPGQLMDGAAIGSPYGELATVSKIRIHNDPTDDETDTVHERGSRRIEQARERLGRLRTQLGVVTGEHAVEIIKTPVETQRFQPEKALNLQFMTANLHLTTVANFKPIVETNQQLPEPPELAAYRAKEQRQRQAIDKALTGSRTNNFGTEDKTTERRNNDKNMRATIVSRVENFLSADPRGKNICRAMQIEPSELNNLAPNQVIELIGQFMYETTKYDMPVTKGAYNRADDMDVLSIIEHGLGKQSKKDVEPLGVCRNYATVGQELFYAFKSTNKSLVNTHCFTVGGVGAAARSSMSDSQTGHAWLDFVMVADKGELVATTVDPTWTRKSVDGQLYGYDQIDARIGTHIRTVTATEQANHSNKKDANAKLMTDYYTRAVGKNVAKLQKRYPSVGGKLKLSEIPDKDPQLQSAVFNAIEMGVFSESVGGGTRFKPHGAMKKLVSRAADMSEHNFTKNELYVVLKQVVEDAENPTDADQHRVAMQRLSGLEAISRRVTQRGEMASDVNDGRDLAANFRMYNFDQRLLQLLGTQQSQSLVHDLLGK